MKNNKKNLAVNQVEQFKAKIMNLGLKPRLVMLFAIVSLVPLLSLGFFSYYKSSATIEDITRRYSSDIIREINTNVMLSFKNINEVGKIILNNNLAKSILAKDEESSRRDFDDDNVKMSLLLDTISASNVNIRSVYILPYRNNSIFAIGDITKNQGLVFLNDGYRKNYRASNLYMDTVKADKNNIWWPTQNVLGKNVFILTEKLYDHEKGILGVLVIHIDVGVMEGIYKSIKTDKNSETMLTDIKGRILYHPKSSYISKQVVNRDIISLAARNEEGSFIIKENGRTVFVVFNTFSPNNWKCIAVTSYSDLISEASQIRDATIILFIISLTIVILLSAFLTRSILDPVYKLISLMKKGSTGDMKVRFNAKYNDEIGQLGETFNKMMSDIEKLMGMVEVESKSKVEAEIKALEAQINPHFLYNTLASIYWSAMAKGDTEIGKMAASLSKFFRLGLNKGKEFTTVENEVGHVKEFLSIQKTLYSNVFDYEIMAERGELRYKTIKLVLQPLVENSLIHGFKDKKSGGLIKIEIAKIEGRVVFRVWDNGNGIKDFDKKSLDEIIDTGYGLKNIRDRLRLYFNNDFTIRCESGSDTGTVFEISIPCMIFEEVGSSV